MNTKKMVEKFGAFGVLMNAISMVVDDLTWKEELTENERYLLEAWDEYNKKNGGADMSRTLEAVMDSESKALLEHQQGDNWMVYTCSPTPWGKLLNRTIISGLEAAKEEVRNHVKVNGTIEWIEGKDKEEWIKELDQ